MVRLARPCTSPCTSMNFTKSAISSDFEFPRKFATTCCNAMICELTLQSVPAVSARGAPGTASGRARAALLCFYFFCLLVARPPPGRGREARSPALLWSAAAAESQLRGGADTTSEGRLRSEAVSAHSMQPSY